MRFTNPNPNLQIHPDAVTSVRKSDLVPVNSNTFPALHSEITKLQTRANLSPLAVEIRPPNRRTAGINFDLDRIQLGVDQLNTKTMGEIKFLISHEMVHQWAMHHPQEAKKLYISEALNAPQREEIVADRFAVCLTNDLRAALSTINNFPNKVGDLHHPPVSTRIAALQTFSTSACKSFGLGK